MQFGKNKDNGGEVKEQVHSADIRILIRRIAQGTLGQGLGTETRSVEKSGDNGNREAMWRDFE